MLCKFFLDILSDNQSDRYSGNDLKKFNGLNRHKKKFRK